MDNQYPKIMGIVNVTPDSFSDGGKHETLSTAVAGALKMVEQGVHWLDVGGESTRPGAAAVEEQQELDRVIPVIEALRERTDIPISIDTSKAVVMKEAVAVGAAMVNDVCALTQPDALETAVKCGVPVCLMHMQGTPRTMQHSPQYLSVVDDVLAFLEQRAKECIRLGMVKNDILFDPGFGFGKTAEHNYQLLANLQKFVATGHKVLVGMSRKSMIGAVTDKPIEKRLAGSVAAATLAMLAGAHIIRVHDVDETVDALKVYSAFKTVEKHK